MNAGHAPSRGAPLYDVVSVQSQVAHGGVGNSIAVPALQALGLQVAPVPTVVLGNTPHHPTMHGGALPQHWFEGLLSDLVDRDTATRARLLLVGYLGTAAQGLALARWIDRVRERHPALRVQIDPVIGDHDTGRYTDPALVPVWREHLLPRAQGLTPNHYEMEQLCGRDLPTLDDCTEAARRLVDDGAEWVAVTSAAPAQCPPDRLWLVAVSASGAEVIEHSRVMHAVKGTGDLFAALLGGRVLQGMPLVEAVRRSGDDVVAVLRHGLEHDWQELALPPHLARGFARQSL